MMLPLWEKACRFLSAWCFIMGLGYKVDGLLGCFCALKASMDYSKECIIDIFPLEWLVEINAIDGFRLVIVKKLCNAYDFSVGGSKLRVVTYDFYGDWILLVNPGFKNKTILFSTEIVS